MVVGKGGRESGQGGLMLGEGRAGPEGVAGVWLVEKVLSWPEGMPGTKK